MSRGESPKDWRGLSSGKAFELPDHQDGKKAYARPKSADGLLFERLRMSAAGRSLELYYINGRPDGMLTARMFNWSGQILVAPRTQLSEALARQETTYAGVYVLTGEQDGEPLAYIGESEVVGARIRTHDVEKDWWTTAILTAFRPGSAQVPETTCRRCINNCVTP